MDPAPEQIDRIEPRRVALRDRPDAPRGARLLRGVSA